LSEKVEKAVEAAQPLLQKLSEYLDAAQAVVLKYAPDVWDATLTIIRLQSVFDICLWLASCGLAIYGIRSMTSLIKANVSKHWTERPDWPWVLLIGSSVLALGCILTIAASGFEVLLGAISPDLAVLYRLGANLGMF
jgi:hypothetical protein